MVLSPAFGGMMSAAVVFTFLAVVLLRQARRSARTGTTPRCAKCSYNLTGLSSQRCPECGTELTAGTIVYGDFRRSWSRMILGCVCLAIAAIGYLGAIRSVDWYQLRPTTWLISDLSSSNAGTGLRAWTELMRRDQSGSLSADRQNQLVERCLKEQAGTRTGPLITDMMSFLGRRLMANQLSAEHKELFFGQAVQLSLTVRPQVAVGDFTPYRIAHAGRGPSEDFWVRMTHPRVLVDGKVVQEGSSGSSGWSGIGAGGSFSSSIKVVEPGRHTLTIENYITCHKTPFDENRMQATLLHEKTVPLSAEFEVVPSLSNRIQKITDPAQRQPVENCMVPADFRFRRDKQGTDLSGSLKVTSPPVSLAFQVAFRINGKEYPASSISVPRGSSTSWSVGKWWHEKEMADAPDSVSTVDIILRGSEEVARNTVELSEFWGGEIVYKDVPVQVSSPATQSTQPALP